MDVPDQRGCRDASIEHALIQVPLESMGQSQSRWRRNQLTPSQLRGKVQDIKAKSLKKLILNGRLAPCYEGQDDDEAGKVRFAYACLAPLQCMMARCCSQAFVCVAA